MTNAKVFIVCVRTAGGANSAAVAPPSGGDETNNRVRAHRRPLRIMFMCASHHHLCDAAAAAAQVYSKKYCTFAKKEKFVRSSSDLCLLELADGCVCVYVCVCLQV